MSTPRPDVSIVTSGHDVADARLHREVAALQRAGMSVEVLGLGDAGAAPAGTSVRTRARPGLAGRAVSAATAPWRARGRVVLVLDPDLVPAAVAHRALGRGRALVVDVHEDYARLLADRAWAAGPRGRIARALVALSTRGAARADLTVVADDHVPPAGARRRLVVRNLPDPAMLPAVVAPEPAPRAVYVGDVRASRGLWAMVAALEASPAWSLDVVGPVAAADQPRLDHWLASSDHAARLRLHGRLPPARSWQVAAGAWVGLSLLEPTPAFLDAVPSKLAEYRACGLAVVCTDLPRQREWIQDVGVGVVVPTGDSSAVGGAVAAVLGSWAADPAPVAQARAAAADARAQQSDYDRLAAAVSSLLRA